MQAKSKSKEQKEPDRFDAFHQRRHFNKAMNCKFIKQLKCKFNLKQINIKQVDI